MPCSRVASNWVTAMRGMKLKMIIFLCIWYEVGVELGLGGGTAFAVALLLIGLGMTLLRVPGQLLATPGMWPLMVWLGLALWLMPGLVLHHPALILIAGALLAVIGAGARYANTRYTALIAPHRAMMRGGVVPVTCALLGFANEWQSGWLTAPILVVLIGMPLRMGWRFVGVIPPHRFDAKTGNAGDFRRDGFSDET